MEHNEQLEKLQEQLKILTQDKNKNRAEIRAVKLQIDKLLYSRDAKKTLTPTPDVSPIKLPIPPKVKKTPTEGFISRGDFERPMPPTPKKELPKVEKETTPPPPPSPIMKGGMEAFIGGNLINKIGIIILIIGIGLFVKYTMDSTLLTEWMRVGIGYGAGSILIAVALWLKKKYTNYSAVLLSGGIAILYLTSFGGHTFFEPPVLSSTTAFLSMLLFTVGVVMAAIYYDLQVIALVGILGAYAVPVLLRDDGGEIRNFFIYLSVINVGILFLSAFKDWKSTLLTAFGITWLVFLYWLLNPDFEESTSYLFSSIFYALFFIGVLVNKFIKRSPLDVVDYVVLIVNMVVYYLVLMETVSYEESYRSPFFININLGLAAINFIFGFITFKILKEKSFFRVLSALAFVCLNIAILLGIEQPFVMYLWLGEGIILFAFGRWRSDLFFEGIALAALTGALISLGVIIVDEILVSEPAFSNALFGAISVVSAGLGIFYFLHHKWLKKGNDEMNNFLSVFFPLLLGFLLFSALFSQIRLYYSLSNYRNWWDYRYAWLFNYVAGFLSVILFINLKWWKNKALNYVLFSLSMVVLLNYWLGGFQDLDELKTDYIKSDGLVGGFFLRYVVYGFMGILFYIIHKTISEFELSIKVKNSFFIILNLLIVMILSHELITLYDFVAPKYTNNAYEVGFSILWSLYAFALVGFGFAKKKALWRISGIVLFGITLVKIFFLDIVDLSVSKKVIVFISVGVLLLVVSYLYQRFKKVIE